MKHNFDTFDNFKTFFKESVSCSALPETIIIADITYQLVVDNQQRLLEVLAGVQPFVVVYTPEKGPSIGLSWMFSNGIPDLASVEMISSVQQITEGDNIIGDTVELSFPLFPKGNNIRGKVDTGADVSSLHATEWKINGEKISFKAPHLSENVITMVVKDKQAVKSADGGVEYRPVIELDVSVNGKMMSRVIFNLNDRSHMEFPILVGQNILEKGKFLINPSINEHLDSALVNWSEIRAFFRSKE